MPGLPELPEIPEDSPLSEKLEIAWKRYAMVMDHWRKVLEKTTYSSLQEEEKLQYLRRTYLKASMTLGEYFDIYDRDQEERFGPNPVKVRV